MMTMMMSMKWHSKLNVNINICLVIRIDSFLIACQIGLGLVCVYIVLYVFIYVRSIIHHRRIEIRFCLMINTNNLLYYATWFFFLFFRSCRRWIECTCRSRVSSAVRRQSSDFKWSPVSRTSVPRRNPDLQVRNQVFLLTNALSQQCV